VREIAAHKSNQPLRSISKLNRCISENCQLEEIASRFPLQIFETHPWTFPARFASSGSMMREISAVDTCVVDGRRGADDSAAVDMIRSGNGQR
jgi:hypothetical protein